MLQASLKAHDVERVQARIRRHNLTPAVSQAQSRAVTVLNSSDIVGMSNVSQVDANMGKTQGSHQFGCRIGVLRTVVPSE